MAVNRLRFAVAQLGRKAGAGDRLACLLRLDDLPGAGWRVLDERTWRTGVAGPPTPWGGRARAAGSVTAWRSFQDAAGRRWVWVAPFLGASAVWAHEQHTTGAGGEGASLLLAGVVGVNIVVVCASGSPAWDWEAVSELAARQADHLAAGEIA